MYSNNGMYSIAEVPMKPHGWILNGWLSAIVNIDKANEILKKIEIANFIKQNINTLEKILHLYDVKEYCISKYNLTQFYYFRLLKKQYSIRKVIFEYTNDDPIIILPKECDLSDKKSRWEFYVIKKYDLHITDNQFVGSKIFQFNGILTLSGFPQNNSIKIIFNKPIIKENIKFQAYIGEYDPLHSSAVSNKWITINNENIKIENNIFKIDLPYSLFNNTIGYPTNFMKKFNNGRRNTYHDIHIKWLIYLGDKYHKKLLLEMANKWLLCKKDWKNISVYKKLFNENNILIDNDFLKFLDKYYK